jgi:hypothetical protein
VIVPGTGRLHEAPKMDEPAPTQASQNPIPKEIVVAGPAVDKK